MAFNLMGSGATATASPAAAAGPPASVTISPVEDYNPIRTQHTLVAQVKDATGAPVSGARVEWVLNRAPGLVGDIICLCGSDPQKVDNTFGVAKTDDKGEARLTITSTREGDTDVTAYVPGIEDPAAHKVFALKHWLDLAARFPDDAVNSVGTRHVMTVQVSRITDGKPLAGVPVRWDLTDSPPTAFFTPPLAGDAAPGATSVVTSTELNGSATITLQQTKPAQGVNKVRISVLAPGNPGFVVLSKDITKTWQASILGLTKTGPAQVGIGQQITYKIDANNSGDSAATAVVLVDTLPAGMSYVSSTPVGIVSGNVVTWSVGTLAPKATQSFSLVLRANTAGTWTNTARITAGTGAAAEASATTKVVQPVLKIQKTGPAQANLGADFSYDITVRNQGDGAATAVTVRDTLPAGLTFVGATPTGTVAGNEVTWNVGSLNSGASTIARMTVKGVQAGAQENVVVVTSAEPSTDTARASTLILVPAVSIAKTGPSAIPAGFTRTYTLSVTNTGATALNDVTVSDELPSGLTYQSATPAGTLAGNRVAWNLGTLAVREVKDIKVILKGDTAGTWTNVATVGAREGVGARAALPIAVVEAFSGATMSLVDSIDPVAVGELVTYTIVVENQAVAQDLHNMTITAVIPTQMTFVSATGPSAYTIVGQEVRFVAVGTVRPVGTLAYTVTALAAAPGSVLFTSTMRYDEFPPGPILVQEATTIFRP